MSVLCIWDGTGWKGNREGFDLETEDLGGGGGGPCYTRTLPSFFSLL